MNKKMRTKRRARLLWAFALLALVALLLLPAAALAQDEAPAAEEAVAEEAPTLDYTFTWPTFVLTFGLVIGYYVFLYRMSEKEFKGVIAERFGPGRS